VASTPPAEPMLLFTGANAILERALRLLNTVHVFESPEGVHEQATLVFDHCVLMNGQLSNCPREANDDWTRAIYVRNGYQFMG
jgi:hypothetical protein